MTSLYERLGGIHAIAGVVNDFSEAMITDPIIGRESSNEQLREWHTKDLNRVPGAKVMRTLWVADVTGGPYKYVSTNPGRCDTCVEEVHRKLKVNPEQYQRFVDIVSATLDLHGVKDPEKKEVMDSMEKHRPEAIEGFTDSS
jgi:hemoglobin